MIITSRWLANWCQPNLFPTEVAQKLTSVGLTVESIRPIGADLEKIVVGQITSVIQHPNADQLSCCEVLINEQSSPLTIVCGAKNVTAGSKVIVALVGAVLPGNVRIQTVKLRGIESAGMICSQEELGLGQGAPKHILILPSNAPVGVSGLEYLQLPDTQFHIELTTNRGDCASLLGIARELHAVTGATLRSVDFQPVEPQHTEGLTVQVEAPEACPRYRGCYLTGLDLEATSPLWLIERLRRCGLSNVHPVVDVANYVMLELGQPLHAFDADRLSGILSVRFARFGEQISLLSGETVSLTQEDLVISDDYHVQALAGIMGSQESAVHYGTTQIFLESAHFTPRGMNQTVKRLKCHTEASYRFTRGVDPELPEKALMRAIQLLQEITGAQVGSWVKVDSAEHLPTCPIISFHPQRVQTLTGMKLAESEMQKILKQLGCHLQCSESNWQVTPPSWRFDLAIEADIVEEVVRIAGYDRLIEVRPLCSPRVPLSLSLVNQTAAVRSWLAAQDYQEVVTYGFISPTQQEAFFPNQEALTILNPLSRELSVMRGSLWPGLIQVAYYNQARQQDRIRLFEVGSCFQKKENRAEQTTHLAALILGPVFPPQWSETSREVDFFDLKGMVELLLQQFGEVPVEWKREEIVGLHGGQSLAFYHSMTHERLGYLGKLHPALVKKFNFSKEVYLVEMDFLFLTRQKTAMHRPISKYPSIQRDLSLLVPDSILVTEVINLIKRVANQLLNRVELFDIFCGKGIIHGYRSISLALHFQDTTKTLLEGEVNTQVTRLLVALENELNVKLRETHGTN